MRGAFFGKIGSSHLGYSGNKPLSAVHPGALRWKLAGFADSRDIWRFWRKSARRAHFCSPRGSRSQSPRPSRCMNRSRELERQRIDRMSFEERIRLALGLQERLALPTGAADNATLLRTRRAAAVVHEGPWRCLRFITRRPAGRDVAFLFRHSCDGIGDLHDA